MTGGVVRAVLVLSVLAGCVAEAWAILVPLVRVESRGAPVAPVSSAAMAPVGLSDSLIRLAVSRPMFRPGRHPSSVAFDPDRPGQTEATPPPAPKPALLVSGIVWGRRPAVIVEGVPGVEGPAVLRRGESAGGIRAVRIEPDRVVLRGVDTTWNLPVREPWK